MLTGAGEGVIFGIGLKDGAVLRLADAPGVAEIPAFELALNVETGDDGCACCVGLVANAFLSCALQEIAACDGPAVVIPHDAAAIGAGDGAGVVAVFDGAAVIPHNAATVVFSAGDGAVVVAVFDGAAVIPHNAADILATTDRAGVVGVCDDATVVPPHNTADRTAAAVDAAGVVAVCNDAAVPPHNAADAIGAADIAGVVAVCNVGIAAVTPHNAADINAAALDAAGVGAVYDAAAVQPHNAADVVIAADAACKVAIFDATAVIPHNTADVVIAADAAGNAEVLHGAFTVDKAKEALIIGIAAGVFYVEAADGVAVAVKVAAVSAVAADWVPRLIAEIDVVGEDGVGGRFAAVNELGKIPQLLGGSNLVRIICCAGAAGERSLTTL